MRGVEKERRACNNLLQNFTAIPETAGNCKALNCHQKQEMCQPLFNIIPSFKCASHTNAPTKVKYYNFALRQQRRVAF